MALNVSWKKEWQRCERILCVRPDNMGDVVMMTPAFKAIKESLPEVKITLLTSSVGNRIIPFIPNIDDSIIYDAPWIENKKLKFAEHDDLKIVSELRLRKFDGAILLTNYSQNPLPLALLMYLAGIKKVLGYCRELPGELINYWVPDTEPFAFPVHGVLRQLNLLEHIGIKATNNKLSLKIKCQADNELKNILELKEIEIEKPFIILHPGVSLIRRRYPPNLFIKAAKTLISDLNYQILLTGSGEEKTLTTKMQKAIGRKAFSLADELNLDVFITLIKRAAVLISNNTGPIHIAAAVGTPVVDLYARSNPEHTPWKIPSRVLYFDIPPYKMTDNTILLYTTPKVKRPMPQPEHVVQAVKELLGHTHKTILPKDIITWDESYPKSKGLTETDNRTLLHTVHD